MTFGEKALAVVAVAATALSATERVFYPLTEKISPLAAGLMTFLAAVVGGLRLFISPPLSVNRVEMRGKWAVVTGGSSGVGMETVRMLASWNATVILACRDLKKGEAAAAKIRKSLPKGSKGEVLVWHLDLADFSSVRRFATRFQERGTPLHVLVNNGGVRYHALSVTKDGIELHYQVNHLSHVLLSKLLLPMLRKTPNPRIVHVSSSAHAYGEVDTVAHGARLLNKDPEMFKGAMRRLEGVYGDTKLMQVIFSEELQARTRDFGLDSFAVHPGFVATGFGASDRRWMQTGLVLLRPFLARNAKQACMNVVYAATDSKLQGKGGGYIDNCALVPRALLPKVTPEVKKWLWEESHRIVGLNS